MIELGCCSLCGHDFDAPDSDGRAWLVLNRWAVGRADGMLVMGAEAEDNERSWSVDEDWADLTGPLLCWPTCAATWIEGELIEQRVRAGES